jgi:predicted nucleotidyltransferase
MEHTLLSTMVQEQPYPLLFATVSGAHLYGFPSHDSDYDLRGVHLLPLREVIGLNRGKETIQSSVIREGKEIDLVTHDAEKFFRLLLKKNGYVLEQLFSPLIIYTTPAYETLKQIASACITRYHAHHYLGFAQNQWRLFSKEEPRRVKPLLYVFRVLLTGIHLMRTGNIEANLVTLNEEFRLSYLPDLITRKLEGAEKSLLSDTDRTFLEGEYHKWLGELESAYLASTLPEEPQGQQALHELLINLRLEPVL